MQAGQVAAEVWVGRQISRRARPSTAFCRKFDNITRQKYKRLKAHYHIKNLIFLFTWAGLAALHKSSTVPLMQNSQSTDFNNRVIREQCKQRTACNTLDCGFNGRIVSSAKHLMFSIIYFSINLQK